MAASCPPFFESPTICQPQLSKKSSIYAEQSLDFWIIVKILSYRSIGLCTTSVYCLFVVEQLYEDKRRNVGNKVQFLNLYVISCTVFIVNWSMLWTKILFFLNSIHFYVKSWTIVQPKYDIIIYKIYLSSSNQHFIAIKGNSSKSVFWEPLSGRGLGVSTHWCAERI